MKEKLKNWRDQYVVWHANTYPIPTFEESRLIRKKVWFYGRVQNVGFRLETQHLAKRIGLIGSVQILMKAVFMQSYKAQANKFSF